MTNAMRDVLAERERQKAVEGWGPEHDDTHDNAALASLAACYCESAAHPLLLQRKPGGAFAIPRCWPKGWDLKWWKPKSPRQDLVRAGALILAEIERLDRAEARGK